MVTSIRYQFKILKYLGQKIGIITLKLLLIFSLSFVLYGKLTSLFNKSYHISSMFADYEENFTPFIFPDGEDTDSEVHMLDEILNLEKLKWPLVVFCTVGRTGNCFNAYSIAMSLREEFGNFATFAVCRYIHESLKKVFISEYLSLLIVGDNLTLTAKSHGLLVTPEEDMYVKNDMVAHIKPAIKGQIKHFRLTSQKKVLDLKGHPNKIAMIANIQGKIKEAFQIKPELLQKAANYLHDHAYKEGITTFIGFHIRRSDYIGLSQNYFGVPIPGPLYFEDAMKYYQKKYKNVKFVVCTESKHYVKQALGINKNIVFSDMHSIGEDMALLASCNHSIMTVGSFGWWCSWLASGEVVYAKYKTYKISPFASTQMMGDHGFENFHGIEVRDSFVK